MTDIETQHLLKKNNIRATVRKVAILRAVFESGNPVNADELHERVSDYMPVDLVTVYRTLNAFKKSGLVREINDPTGVQYFEVAGVGNPSHAHFKCTECLKLLCLECATSDALAAVPDVGDEFDVREVWITLSGICKDCKGRG